jgi:hypothetical protein
MRRLGTFSITRVCFRAVPKKHDLVTELYRYRIPKDIQRKQTLGGKGFLQIQLKYKLQIVTTWNVICVATFTLHEVNT